MEESCRFSIRRFSQEEQMQKLSAVLLVSGALIASQGCATRKYVRNEVQSASDTLGVRIDTNEGEIKETRDSVDRVNQKVSGVETRVSELDTKTTQGLNSLKTELKTDIQNTDQKVSQVQTATDRVAGDVVLLDQRFQNRNLYTVNSENSIMFRFDSAQLDMQYKDVLDEIANTLMENPDAILVMEGRTDSTGDRDYNVRLGERRVEAVRRYLVVEKSIPVYRIHEISLGSAKPIAANDTRDGRAKNRAVTMSVLVPKTTGSVASRN
jgi:outer membrane protein OmpA-like peptidoglycan-associated protein